jgi:Cu/Ag efflux protein CusF
MRGPSALVLGPWSVPGPWSLVLLLACLWPSGALAQDPKVTTRDVAVVTGKVERLDPFGRSLTLRTPEGLQHTVYAGKELKAFDELRSGDTVTVRISESVVVAVRPNAKMTVVEDSTTAAKKGPDAAAADVLQQLKAVVRVETVDLASQVITYKTADNRNVMRQVTDRKLLEGLKRGDTIEITYTRERAIEITKNR